MPAPDQNDRAIGRIPNQATASIKQVLKNARRAANSAVAEACEAELKLRGAFIMTEDHARQAQAARAKTEGKPLTEVIVIAFTDVHASREEVTILKWIGNNPGTTCAETARAYGRNDLSLAIGHLVYNRFGYFRPFLEGSVQSDVLLSRSTTTSGVCYTLRPEAVVAFRRLGII